MDRDTPLAATNKSLAKIDEKVQQLKASGLTRGDQKILREGRLSFIWVEPNENSGSQESTTSWRRNRARRAYTETQDANDHLFLAVVLAITPTECSKSAFDDTLSSITNFENYEPYRLNLSVTTKRFFESIAAEQGFTSSHRYLKFMQSLFPQTQELREIKYAYSLIRPEDIPSFLETMLRGISTSKQRTREMMQGGKTSGCVTIIVPTSEEEDGSCNLRVDRNVLIEAIYQYRLSDLRLE